MKKDFNKNPKRQQLFTNPYLPFAKIKININIISLEHK